MQVNPRVVKGIMLGAIASVALIYIFACCVAIGRRTSSADAGAGVDSVTAGASLQSALRGGGSTPADQHMTVRRELGRGTWNMLHRLAAGYPDKPSEAQRTEVVDFFRLLGNMYPCDECAAHFRGMLKEHPVQAGSHAELTTWLCERHNQVNERLHKPAFPCDAATLTEKYGDCGCSDTADGAAAPAAPAAVARGAGGADGADVASVPAGRRLSGSSLGLGFGPATAAAVAAGHGGIDAGLAGRGAPLPATGADGSAQRVMRNRRLLPAGAAER